MTVPNTVRVAIHTALRESAPEASYVLRTLLRLAGVPYRIEWTASPEAADLYYGPGPLPEDALIGLRWNGRSLRDAPSAVPLGLRRSELAATLDFGEGGGARRSGEGVRFDADIVYACYWLLTGAREQTYDRDRWDNLDLAGSALVRYDLLSQPLVSIYASLFRGVLRTNGYAPLPLPWTESGHSAALAITHDVDYPEILRGIETLRLLAARGPRAAATIGAVWRGSSHFWQFRAWLDFVASFGGAPAFYFMARRGSLLQYALGTPDAFYDIASPHFRRLFEQLRKAGAEIGLHASFHAHRDPVLIGAEKRRLEELSGVEVAGNRHHYWHLDPANPAETLRRHEQSGMQYDSSLAFEFHPGFRRGICHPFRPFHPELRRELHLLELPPTWMDDHFDRRMVKNGITDPSVAAAGLLGVVRQTGGVAVLDYHVRGMNEEFFPRYGKWLREFCEREVDSTMICRTPRELAGAYAEYEAALDTRSVDMAIASPAQPARTPLHAGAAT